MDAVDFIIDRLCTTGDIMLRVVGGNESVEYYWYAGNVLVDSGLNTIVPYSAAPVDYYLKDVQNPNTSVYLATHTVTFYEPLVAFMTSSTPGVTNPFNIGINGITSLTLEANAPASYDTTTLVYQWYVNDQPVFGYNSRVYTFPQNMAAGVYYIRAEVGHPASGCLASTEAFQVNVGGSIVVNVFGPQNVCRGEIVTFTSQVEGDELGHTYQWLRNGQYLVGQTGQTYTFSTDSLSGKYYYSVAVTRDGCEITYSPEIPLTVTEAPIVEITADPETVCLGNSTVLTANLGDYNMPNLTYRWYVDSIASGNEIYGATQSQLTVTPAQLGDRYYYVRVAQSYSDCIAYDSILVSAVNTAPPVTLITSTDTLCEGGLVTVAAMVSADATILWFRNGIALENTGRILSDYPVGAPNGATYVYSAMIMDPGMGCPFEMSYTDTIVVFPVPSVTVSGSPLVCDSGNIITVANAVNSFGGDLNYQWIVNGSNAGINSDTLNISVPQADQPYMVEVNVANSLGCSVTSDPYYIYVNTNPQIMVELSDTMVCPGGTVNVTAMIEGDNGQLSYTWSRNGTVLPSLTTNTFSIPVDSDTYFELVVTDNTNSCAGTATTSTIRVIDISDVDVFLTSNYNDVCDGGQVTLTADILDNSGNGTVASDYAFTWYRNGIEIPGVTGTQFTESLMSVDGDTTVFEYSVSIDVPGCNTSNQTASTTVRVRRNPIVAISGAHFVCETPNAAFGNGNISLQAWVDGDVDQNATYRWFESGQLRPQNISYVYNENYPTKTDPYIFTVEVINSNGCSTLSEPFEVTVNARPVVHITANTDTVCPGGALTLTANLNNYNTDMLTYQWYYTAVNDANIIFGATQREYTARPDSGSVYAVRVLQINSGCQANATYSVNVKPLPDIAEIVLSSNNICEGGQVTVTALLNENNGGVNGLPYVYTWYRNGFLIEGVTGPSFTESPEAVDGDLTNYTYSVYVSQGMYGCHSSMVTSPVLSVYANPVVAISGLQHFCETDTVFLIANVDHHSRPVGILHYTWYEHGQVRDNMAAGYGDSQFFNEYFYANESPYIFEVEVTRENGCTRRSEPYLVWVHESPVAHISANNTTVCANGSVELTASLNNYNAENLVYQWYTVDTTQQIIAGGYLPSGDYRYDTIYTRIETPIPGATSLFYPATVTETTHFMFSVHQTTSGCLSYSQDLTINALPTPIVSIDSVENINICDGGQVILYATDQFDPSLGEPVYMWYRNNVLIPGATGSMLIESPQTVSDQLTMYWYSVQVLFPANGCMSNVSASTMVTVAPAQTVLITANSNLTYCEGGSVMLTANVSPENTNTTYEWYRDNVLMGTGSTYTSQDDFRETPYRYHVIVSQNAGCRIASEPVYVNVINQPDVIVSVDYPAICEGGTAVFSATIDGGVGTSPGLSRYTYEWYNNYNTATPLGTDPTYTTSATDTSGIYTYWVVVTSPYGCGSTAYYNNFMIMPDPTVEITVANGYDQTVCDGGSTMLMANVTGGTGENTYQWFRNGIMLAGETGQTLNTGPVYSNIPSAFTVRVIQEGTSCDAISGQFNVDVIPAPVVTITGNNNVCIGGTVTLTAAISGNVSGDVPAYQWYRIHNGYATPIAGATSAQYTTSPLSLGDSYEYYVEVTSPISGCTVISGSVPANVLPEPTVEIRGITNVCEGADVVLNAFVNGGVQGGDYVYTWTVRNNGSQQSYTTDVPVFTINTLTANSPSNPYYFTVSIERTDDSGCDAVSSDIAINIRPAVQAVVTVDNTTICEGGTVTFTSNVNPVGNYNYEWYVNGQLRGYSSVFMTSNLAVGNNAVYVRVIPADADAMCITESAPVTVVVNDDPVVTGVTASVETMCVGGTVTLTITGVNNQPFNDPANYTYQWSENGFEVSGAINRSFTRTLVNPGVYEYSVRITSNNGMGCASDWSEPVQITVAPQPVVNVAQGANGLLDICVGGQVNLNASITNNSPVYGNVTYEWYASGIPTGIIGDTYSEVLNNIGTYNFMAVATFDGAGCNFVNSNPITVNVNADPTWTSIQVVTSNADGIVCEGERIYLNASVQGGVTDAGGNTNGIIQWYVIPEGASEQLVDGGMGASSWDDPDGYGNFNYLVRYTGQLGDGCNLADGIPGVNSEGFTISVHPMPTASFTAGDGATICSNNFGDIAELEITFTGTAPFHFMLQDMSNNQTTAYGPIYQNPYTVYVQPQSTTSYRIVNLSDAYCTDPGTGTVTSITVSVSRIEVPELYVMDCESISDPNEDPTVSFPVNILSGFATRFSVEFVDPALSGYNVTDREITRDHSGYYLQFVMPRTPGNYPMVITIDGCEYYTVVRVPVIGNMIGGNPLVDQRWDDVVVVNNNPANNGGYTFYSFQWYKNGQIIPGATGQYYQEVGGLNGEYSVSLSGRGPDGNVIEFTTCGMTFISDNYVKVYPVPAKVNQIVTVEVGMTEEELQGAILDIFDAKGAHVQSITTVLPITKVDGFKSQGSYFGRIITAKNEIKTVKFVIVR